MSNMRFSHARPTKSKGIYIVGAICLVAVGAVAFFGVDRNIGPNSTAQNSSVASLPSDSFPFEDYGAMEVPDTSTQEKEKVTSVAPTSQPEEEPQDAVETVTQVAGFFVYPVTGEIIKDFSDTELQYSLTYDDWRMHRGVDIKAAKGTAINAAGDGVVIDVYEDAQYGKTVEINHGNDIIATYSGLDEVTVKAGDVIGVNVQMGTLGKVPCESVETAHLHFEVRKGDKYISPLSIIGVQ